MNLDPRTWNLDPRQVKLTGWKRTAAYVAFFVVAFIVALRLTFPVEAVKERLILDAAAQGYQIKVNDLSPSGLIGIQARELTITTADGTRIPVERLDVGLRIWPTLRGRRAFTFDANVFGGRIRGATDTGKEFEHYEARLDGVDLSRAAVIATATGLDLAGVVSGNLDVTLDIKDTMKSTGVIDLQVKDAAIRGGKIPVPGMEGGLTVPPVKLGAIAAKAALKGGRVEFAALESKGDDVEFTAEQVFIQLQPRLDFSPLAGRARIKPSESFWKKEQVSPLRPVIEVALSSARGKDGAYGFQIYGTLTKPQARPAAY